MALSFFFLVQESVTPLSVTSGFLPRGSEKILHKQISSQIPAKREYIAYIAENTNLADPVFVFQGERLGGRRREVAGREGETERKVSNSDLQHNLTICWKKFP